MRSISSRARPFLSLLDATFRLGERPVFPHTNWAFNQDQHWAVIGPNGSGKSWFADAIRGRIPLIHGELAYGFRAPRTLAPEAMIGHVGFEDRKSELHGTVVQSRWNSLEDESTLLVKDFLSYERVMDINPFEVASSHNGAEAAFLRRRRRAVRLMNVDSFLDRALISLSNGERQRVQWARALCHPLKLLILDDPFTGLDARVRAYFHELLDRLMQTPLRILLITTRADELPSRITHVLQMDQFHVVAAGARTRLNFSSRHLPARGLAKTLDQVPGPRSQVPGTRNNSRSAGAASMPRFYPEDSAVQNRGPVVLVDLRDVTVRYGTKIVLDKVTWTIRVGESWALLGENGAGKTTLLSLILGDNPQAYGNHVVVFGRHRGQGESIWDLKRHIGWVSPELQLHFNDAISCLEVVASGFRETIGLFEPATARQRTAARKWLKHFELLDLVSSPLSALSLGQQRMVLLARALVKKPRLLILDEPCQGLDLEHRDLFLASIDRLIRRRATTAIYVTHRPKEIPRSITRVLRLSAGRAAFGKAGLSRVRAVR